VAGEQVQRARVADGLRVLTGLGSACQELNFSFFISFPKEASLV
jgi:hypothetical protein